MINDRFEDLELLFNERIELIKNASYEDLITICDEEGIDYEGLTENELRDGLIEYFEEELDEEE